VTNPTGWRRVRVSDAGGILAIVSPLLNEDDLNGLPRFALGRFPVSATNFSIPQESTRYLSRTVLRSVRSPFSIKVRGDTDALFGRDHQAGVLRELLMAGDAAQQHSAVDSRSHGLVFADAYRLKGDVIRVGHDMDRVSTRLAAVLTVGDSRNLLHEVRPARRSNTRESPVTCPVYIRTIHVLSDSRGELL
jgi:hypothetical protein